MRAFGWCASGQHGDCRRKLRVFLVDKKGVQWVDRIIYCGCTSQKCLCSKWEKAPFTKELTSA